MSAHVDRSKIMGRYICIKSYKMKTTTNVYLYVRAIHIKMKIDVCALYAIYAYMHTNNNGFMCALRKLYVKYTQLSSNLWCKHLIG